MRWTWTWTDFFFFVFLFLSNYREFEKHHSLLLFRRRRSSHQPTNIYIYLQYWKNLRWCWIMQELKSTSRKKRENVKIQGYFILIAVAVLCSREKYFQLCYAYAFRIGDNREERRGEERRGERERERVVKFHTPFLQGVPVKHQRASCWRSR